MHSRQSRAFMPALLMAACGSFFLAAPVAMAGSSTKPIAASEAKITGGLFLVSVGTGDPDNMTIKARKVIDGADVILAMRPEQVREQYPDLMTGKSMHKAGHGLFMALARRGKASLEEVEAHEEEVRGIVRDAVAAGKRVVIISNGDPTIYGPHTGYLKEFGDLKPQVIPGISSFNAANAALVRGVTNGSKARSVVITTAWGASRGGEDSLERFAKTGATMVFFMDRDFPTMVAKLKKYYPEDTSIAIVANAGYSDSEQVMRGTLASILEQVGDDKLPPHLVYVGDFLK